MHNHSKNMNTSASSLAQLINSYLSTATYSRPPKGLYDPIEYVLSLGGKRIRPVLMMLSYLLYKENPQDILPQAAGIETYHNYTLLHDDLMDRADMRRGQLTVHKKWDDNTAILSGDAMLVLAYQWMAQCDARHLPEVTSVFSQTALEICEGQQWDMEFETRTDVTIPEYIEMIRLKTSVLLAAALKIGAILADAPAEDAQRLYDFGVSMGLAFQLQDDFLDVYGDPKVFGKNIGGDIVCNKKTFMLITALAQANASQRAELDEWIAKAEFDAPAKIAAVTRIYNELHIDALCHEKIEAYYAEGLKHLEAVNVAPERKEALIAFARKLMNRNV
jgi:geranylgeranyl diphosphate synthase type II